jgi:hypothetical protein
VIPMLDVLNTCFIKLVAVLSDEVLDRWHQAIEVERYRRLLNQRTSMEPQRPMTDASDGRIRGAGDRLAGPDRR